MAPAASTTDVYPDRPAHGALAVRHVHVTPAADRARQPAGRAERNRARGRNARRGPSYKYRKPPPWDGRARTAPRRTHALATHTREDAIRWKRTNLHTRSQRHAYTHARARTQMDTNTHMSTHANAHAHWTHTRMHAHARAPKTPVEDPAHPWYPLSIPLVLLFYPLVPPRYPISTP
jgi:hypothetical protein